VRSNGDGSPTRRGFLAATGTALLAGCNGLDGRSDEDERETVYAHELPQATEDGESEPILGEDVPVDIERTVLNERRQRVTELLDTLPMAFGPSDVPNGYVREQLVDAAEEATACVEDARTAETRFAALQSLRRARGEARYAAAGWAFVEDGLPEEVVRTDHEGGRRRGQIPPVGPRVPRDGPRRRGAGPRPRRAEPAARSRRRPAIDLRERVHCWPSPSGASTESARARVADATYLSDQFTSSLPDDAGTIEETLGAAAESVAADLRDRRAGLPPEPTENDYDLVDRLRYRLRDEAEESPERVAEAQGPASAVLAATEGLVEVGAFDRFQERVDDGESFGAAEAADVRETRTEALDAIRAALSESPRPELARPVLADAAMTVAWADEDLARFSGEVGSQAARRPDAEVHHCDVASVERADRRGTGRRCAGRVAPWYERGSLAKVKPQPADPNSIKWSSETSLPEPMYWSWAADRAATSPPSAPPSLGSTRRWSRRTPTGHLPELRLHSLEGAHLGDGRGSTAPATPSTWACSPTPPWTSRR